MKTQYVNPIGYGWMVWGGLKLLMGLGFGLIYVLLGGGLAAAGNEEEMVLGAIFGVTGVIVGILLLVLGSLDVAVGWGLTKRAGWARIGAFVISLLNVSSFPFGMLLAVASVVVLLDADVQAEFRGEG